MAPKNLDYMVSDIEDWSRTILLLNENFGVTNVFYAMRPLWTTTKMPAFAPKDKGKHHGYVSIP